MNHPVPLLTLRVIRGPGGIKPETFLGTALRQAYDHRQDQPGFRGETVLGPRFGTVTRAYGDMAWALVSGATFRSSPVPRRADVLETGDISGD